MSQCSFFIKNSKWTGVEFNPGFRSDWPVTTHLSPDTDPGMSDEFA
jgi:hypothetical protein